MDVSSIALSEEKKRASKSHKGRKGKQSSEPSILEVLSKHLDFEGYVEAWNKALGQCGSSHIDNIDFLIPEEHVPISLRDCRWGDHVTVHVPQAN